MQCTGTSKQNQRQCERAATPGRQVCYYHGSRSRRGADHPNFQHGRRTKSLPKHLAAIYEEVVGDPELLSLRGDLALLETRLLDLLAKVDLSESEGWRVALKRSLDAFRTARAKGNLVEMDAALQAHESLIDGKLWPEHLAWVEIRSILRDRAHLAGEERQRLKAMEATLTAEQAMALLGAAASLIKRYLTAEEMTEFDRDLGLLLGASLPRPATA